MIDAQIDNYRIIEKIGDGGMGSVYKAVDVMLEREVALKFLRPELSQQRDLVDRFRAEAIVLAKLTHQNIASLYGLHRHGDDLFMAMEFVPGETLEALLRRDGPLPLERAVAVASDVLQALDYAHKRGVVHRDVKTANIIVMPTGGVKVMDFGIARVLGTERRTRVGFVVGTIGYMAPEQIQGLEVDGRTDIYALGVVLYEMLTGRMPFQGDTEYAVMQAQIQQMPVPPRVFAPVPVPVENTVMRALAKLPQERFQTATDFNIALHTAVRQSAMYPNLSAPFSASADETREFKSDPQLLVPPASPSGVAPAFPIPPSSDAHLPPPSGSRVPPAWTPPPLPPPVAPGPPPTATPPPVPAAPLAPLVEPAAASSPAAASPAGRVVTGEPVDPDATVVLRRRSAPGEPRPTPADRPVAEPTVLTPVPGPPPLPPPASLAGPRPPTAPPAAAPDGAASAPEGGALRPDTGLSPEHEDGDIPTVIVTPAAPRPAVRPPTVPPAAVPLPPGTAAPAPAASATPPRPATAAPKAQPPAPPPQVQPAVPVPGKGVRAGLVVLVAGIAVLGVLAAAGYMAWQRWRQQSTDQTGQGTALENGATEPMTLTPVVDLSVVPLAAVPPPPLAVAVTTTVPREVTTTTTVPAIAVLEPVPSPVPPVIITPPLKPASPKVAPPPAVAPAMFGDAKWMRVEGSRVREVDALLQLTGTDVRVLDERGRSPLVSVPFTAISHVTYSSGKRPVWRKEVGPVPTESVFDSTVRTYHYLAFQGGSHFVLVRVDRDDLPRLREELQKRANLTVENAR